MSRLVILLLSAFFVCSCKQQSVSDNPRISELPDFKSICLDRADSTIVEKNSFTKTYVMFFSPECDFCEDEIMKILANKENCSDCRFIFITQPILKNEMLFFLETVPMNEIPNSVILYDNSMRFHSIYGVSAPPATFIYDKAGRLRDEFYSYTEMDKVMSKKYGKK